MIDVPPEFLSFLKDEAAKAEDTDTDSRREVALDFYNGELFGDEEDGRSQLVTRDVAEVVDYMTVSLLRTVVSGDRVVEFEGRSQAQDEISDDATEAVTQNFMRRQKGYQLVHDWIKAGLIEITGVVKTYAEEKETRRELEVSASELAMLHSRGIKPTESEPIGQFAQMAEQMQAQMLAPPPPQMSPDRAAQFEQQRAQWLDQLGPMMRVAWKEKEPSFCDYAVPNGEFRCAPDARDLDSAIYLAHVPPKTVSDLAKMGFDAADLEELETSSSASTNIVERARDGGVTGATLVDRTGANRAVDYREEHCLYDLNEDGIAERLMVHRVGDHVLALEEVDDHPFEEWCPFPMPHRRIGQSLAEKVMDIQRTRSVVLRQTMDGFYFANAPRTFVNEDALGESTIEDLLTIRPGSIVRYRGPQRPEETQARFDVSAGLSMLEQLIGERESRTGITRLNQGLDADALNKTATGTALMQAQGQQIEEYLARNFAEALARLFRKKLKLMKAHGGIEPMRVGGEFKQVDPSKFDAEMDLSVNVGLGSGKKEQRLVYRMQLLEIQRECLANGLRIVGEEEVYNSIKGVVADSGLGTETDFVKDPAQLPPEDPNAQQPDPETMKAQAEIAKGQAELQQKQAQFQADQEEAQARFQMDTQREQSKAELERAKAEAAANLAREKAGAELELARQKAAAEFQLEREQLAHERQMASVRAANEHEFKMSQNRPGGDLSK